MRTLLLVVALLLAPAIAAGDPLPAPKLKLVSPGKGKTQELRFAPTKGAKGQLVMTSQQSKARGMKGKMAPTEWMPPIRLAIEIAIKDVTQDGDVQFAFSYAKTEVLPDKRVKPELTKAYEAGVGVLSGITGSATASSRGITKEMKFDMPADASPQVKAAIEMARGVATQLAQPLPEEAVAVGAKWQTTSTAVLGEVTAVTTATYELLAIKGTQVKLKVSLTSKGKGSGDGNLTTDTVAHGVTTLNLSSLLPTASTLEMRTETGLDVNGRRLLQVDTNKATIPLRSN